MKQWPRPHVPIQPVLSLRAFLTFNHTKMSSILDAGELEYVTSGRVAIARALQYFNIKTNDKVLIPAYHCNSMVEPVVWLNAVPVFYKIHGNAAVDLNDIAEKLVDGVRVLMVTHYFGFPQNIDEIREFCDSHNLMLIEDCAHAFFGQYNGKALGTFGDFSIASIMKFYPVYDGGCLGINTKINEHRKIVNSGLAFQIKAILNSLEYAFEYNRLKLLKYTLGYLLQLKDFVWSRIKASKKSSSKSSIGPASAEGGYLFESSWVNKGASWISRLTVRATNVGRLIDNRRKNYLCYQEAFKNISGAKPLFPDLLPGVVPYVYPLVMDDPSEIFPILKSQGVPIIRFGEFLWDGVDASVCSVSHDLSKRVFQFPCHQDLEQREINWIIEKVKTALDEHGK